MSKNYILDTHCLIWFQEDNPKISRRVMAEIVFAPSNLLVHYCKTNTLSFINGLELRVGEVSGDINEEALRRIQIREAIKVHFEKEQALFNEGISRQGH